MNMKISLWNMEKLLDKSLIEELRNIDIIIGKIIRGYYHHCILSFRVFSY